MEFLGCIKLDFPNHRSLELSNDISGKKRKDIIFNKIFVESSVVTSYVL